MSKAKERAKGFIFGVILAILLTATVTAAANTERVTREIVYGVNVMLNGEMVRFNHDSRPFIMGDRTFLPLRALADLVGLPVDFDAATNTVILGQRTAGPVRTPLTIAAPAFSTGRTGAGAGGAGQNATAEMRDSSTVAGIARSNVMSYFSSTGPILPRNEVNGAFSLHNLGGQFRMFTGYVGRADVAYMMGATVEIRGDGVLLQTLNVAAADMPTPFSVFVEGISQLRIDVIFPRVPTTHGIFVVFGYLE